MSDQVLLQHRKKIDSAEHVEELRHLRDRVHEHMETLLPTRQVEQWNEQLNETHDAFIQKAINLAEEEMARLGKGSPPVPYAYLLFGSGGRKEQTLSSDQDSGLIYDNNANHDPVGVRTYFSELSTLIVQNLVAIGYPPCDGKVLSSNPDWCNSLQEWNTILEAWFSEPSWEAVRYLLIIADCRCIHGEESLYYDLRNMFFTDTLNHPMILKRMTENTMRHKVLVGVFGQLLKERYGEDTGSVDVKYGAYIPMVNSIRMMAIQANVRESSTIDRITRLVDIGHLSDMEGREYKHAFLFILRLRLMTTGQIEEGVYTNTGMLHSDKLTKEMTDELKNSLKAGKKLQRMVYKQLMGRLM